MGLLAGLVAALVKMLGSRAERLPSASIGEPAPASGSRPEAPWPRLDHDPAVPAPPQLGLVPDPDAPHPHLEEDAVVAEPAPVPAVAPPRARPLTPAEPAPAAPAKVAQKVAKEAVAPKPATKAAAKKGTAKRAAPPRPWVEPEGDVCPATHPVKAKLASKIFHLPGMLNYARTRPDRCYRDAEAAEADGLRPAKR